MKNFKAFGLCGSVHVKRKRQRIMRDGTETTSSSSSSPALDCDVGLGLRMQLQNYPSQPYSKPMDLNLYRYGRQLAAASDRNANFTTYGSGGSGGDGTFFTITGNQVAFVGMYEEASGL